jgi:DNA-binding LacI/PurR family transcriptional regulator
MRVAVLLYDAPDQFSTCIVELQHALTEEGHTVFMAGKSLVALGMEPARIRRLVLQTEADAWIVQAGSRAVLEWFAAQPVPAIALFGRRDGIAIASAGPEMHPACALAIRQLIALGHRRVVMICRSERRLPSPGLTESILLDELAAHGIPTGDYNLPDWEETREGFRALLSSLFRVTPPTALIIGIGEWFVATQQFLAKGGIRVPEQVSLVCLDTDPSFDWCTPSVAHIRWKIAPVVRRLVRWARSVSQGRNYVKQTLTPAEFIPGGTIGPVFTE